MEKNSKKKHAKKMEKNEDQKTKKYKIRFKKKNKENIEGEEKSLKKTKKKHKKLKRAILIFIALIILAGLVCVGIIAGIFFSDKYKLSKEDLTINKMNTIVKDSEGNVIATLTGDENRKIIALDEMNEYLPKAFVAIEDERYYTHNGIDIKRTLGATVTFITSGGKSSFGGSTITQQMIKNFFKDDADSGAKGIERKIREMARAYNAEKILSKHEILELYLNLIFMGGTNYGVGTASEYYFNKTAKDLTLAECAFLAGINNTPNSYNPFDEENNHADLIKTRTKTVLAKMKELGAITNEEDYNNAVQEVDNGLAFNKGNVTTGANYSYHTAAAIQQAITQLMEQEDLSYDTAKLKLYNNGYVIYSTQVSSIQSRIEEEYKKSKYIVNGIEKNKDGSLKNEDHTQSAMVIIDHSTGQVVGTVGGLGEDADASGINRATQGRIQPGSSIKPLAVIAPSLEKGIITAATVYDDSATTFGGNYSPNNSSHFEGLITVRQAIASSSNVVNVKIMSELGPANSVEMLKKFGITTVSERNEDLSLALGTPNISPLEMAAGYATIANDGVYIQPTFYTKVEDANGNVILEAKQETHRVMSEDNAYILKDILTAPVQSGTASGCGVSGMSTAGKTGSTESYRDRWLCGFTPYYTAATWFGFDTPERPSLSGNNALKIWAAVMKDIHNDLPNASFQRTGNIVTARICLDSGCTATASCTRTSTEVFVKGTVPGACEGHTTLKVCTDTNEIANPYCKNVEEVTFLVKPEKENTKLWSTKDGGKYDIPTTTCTDHKAPEQVTVINVVGEKSDAAKSKLEKLGLVVEIKYSEDKTKTNGVVLKQNVAKDTKVNKGSTITITVNKIQSSNTNTVSNTVQNTVIGNVTP